MKGPFQQTILPRHFRYMINNSPLFSFGLSFCCKFNLKKDIIALGIIVYNLFSEYSHGYITTH